MTTITLDTADRATVPSNDKLQEIGRNALRVRAITVEAMVPGLRRCAAEPIDLYTPASTRLMNVLAPWQGTIWRPYLKATIADLDRQRNCGPGTLGEFVWLARRRAGLLATVTPSEDSADVEPGPDEREVADRGRRRDIEGALRTIWAWALYERGTSSSLEGLTLLIAEGDLLPASVQAARRTLVDLDLFDLTGPVRSSFDVRLAVDEILDGFDAIDRAIVDRRVLAVAPGPTLRGLGSEFGLSRQRVGQREQRILGRMHQCAIAAPVVTRAADSLRTEIGLAVRADRVATDIPTFADRRFDEPMGLAVRYLLWLAGPYHLTDGWLIRSPVSHSIGRTRSAIRALRADGVDDRRTIVKHLVTLGVRASEAEAWRKFVESS